jgi:hypothetical protein
MSSILLALAWPVGVLASAAVVVGAQELGIPIGTTEVTGGLVAFLILREVFGFLKGKKESTGGTERLEVQQRMASCLEKQTEILERMETDQASILQITQQYQATGVCPLTSPEGQERVVRAISKEVRRGDVGRRSG